MKSYDVLCGKERLLIGQRTLIMGILNVTPDSFSDGGKFLFAENAIEHGEFLAKCGADIIDVGGESSRPFSKRISLDEEMSRVIPVIEALSKRVSIPISVDTTKSEVAREAISAGATIVNDISSLMLDSQMAEVVAQHRVGLVLMHMRGSPENMQLNLNYDDLLGEIELFLSNSIDRAVSAGVDRSSIIVDPGLGFGKTAEHNFEIIKRLNKLLSLDVPILIGSSRKKFIRGILKDRACDNIEPLSPIVEVGTQASVAAAVMLGAKIVRVHNVFNTRVTLDVIDSIKNL